MTRKDIIIVAVLTNIGVLSILFMLAFHVGEERQSEISEVAYSITEEKLPQENNDGIEIDLPKTEPADEVDSVLDEIAPLQNENSFIQDEEPIPEQSQPLPQEERPDQQYVEIVVKKGDMLEKIARSNGTTVGAIMRANNLKSDMLKIGQTIRVPINSAKKKTASSTSSTTVSNPTAPSKAPAAQSVQYYTMKSGDNLWKIAKQYNTSVNELLRLNNLDEDGARRLKTGDQIRIY